MGYQKKGYMLGEIATAWIEDFNKLTKVKANGQHRLLVVDGHSFHYTMSFLEYAWKNKIVVASIHHTPSTSTRDSM